MIDRRTAALAVLFFLSISLTAQPKTDDPNSVPEQCVAGVDYEVSLAALRGDSNLDAAVKQANECVTRHPSVVRAWSRRGQLREQLNDWNGAIADFTKAIELAPNDASGYADRGWAYGAKEEFTAALADYDKALALEPNSMMAYIGRGDLHRMQGHADRAFADYQSAINAAEKDGFSELYIGNAYLGRGLVHMQRGNWALAENDLTFAVENSFGAQSHAYESRALVYELQNKNDKALADYDALLKMNSSNTTALERRGALLMKAGQRDKATADFKALVAIDPKNAKAIEALSTLDPKSSGDFLKVAQEKAREEKWPEAIAAYDKAIAATPTADAYLGRANAYASSNNNDRALADYDKAIQLDPKSFSAYNGRAIMYKEKGDIAKAVAEYDRVIAGASPETQTIELVLALESRGDIRAAQNQSDAARADYDKAIEVAAKDAITNYVLAPDAFLGRAKLSIAAGNKDAARADLKRALALNEKHEAAKAELLKLDPPEPKTAEDFLKVALEAGKKNDAKAAIDALNRCVELDPKSLQCHGYLARAHIATRDLAAATIDMTHVIDLNPKDPQSYAARGVTYVMQGKKHEAIRDFRMALDLKPDFEEAKQALARLEGEK
ncbi:MAG: tetratricopeptide repeat protein [Thermoanaerobaculia bacterium]